MKFVPAFLISIIAAIIVCTLAVSLGLFTSVWMEIVVSVLLVALAAVCVESFVRAIRE